MRFAFAVLGLVILAACGTTPSATTLPATPNTPPTPPTGADNATFGGLLNGVRVANGAGAAAFDARLAVAAQAHADDMVANGFFSHTGSNGSQVGDRATAAGYNWRLIGENIAQGQQDEGEVMTAWTNSPPHHANNINPNFEDFALAKADSANGPTWVLVLGAE